MTETRSLPDHPLVREVLVFIALLLAGLLLLPVAIFVVGDVVFGDYGGDGYGQFFESILGRLADGDRFAWFLVLAPYLVVQLFRMLGLAWRLTGSTPDP